MTVLRFHNLHTYYHFYFPDPLPEDGATSASPPAPPPSPGALLQAIATLPTVAIGQQRSHDPMRATAAVPPRQAPWQLRVTRLQHGRQHYELQHGNG